MNVSCFNQRLINNCPFKTTCPKSLLRHAGTLVRQFCITAIKVKSDVELMRTYLNIHHTVTVRSPFEMVVMEFLNKLHILIYSD